MGRPDYRAAFVNAGSFAVAASSWIAGTFVLPDGLGNAQRFILLALFLSAYAFGHVSGQRYAGTRAKLDSAEFRSRSELLDDALARTKALEDKLDLSLSKQETESYRAEKAEVKAARLEERLKRYEQPETGGEQHS